ncbi:ABC transporter ATP-binding protein [Aquibacillus rhizosphaerae]|uniref:ABC transporter ATP-binding protein n=1 Tax=Aquibacillus rhizosphaerae TaxID=3051431 RepID=A0ABT7L6D6_9BACI|nr:ABC transporter ATP-binding protein [Aquibacillus sp. LR5S19]MDL4840171.1 ABC transporter ATP-binding protein [Aquibacillus sp. LR5S19]
MRKNRTQDVTTSRHYQGVKVKKPKISNLNETISRIWMYMSTYKSLFIFVLLLVVVSSSLSLLGPYLLGVAVDEIITGIEKTNLIIIIAILIGVFLLQSVTTWFQNYWMIKVAQHAVYAMRKDLFSHVLRLPILFFQTRQNGEIMSRLTNDIENVSRTLNTSVIQLTTSVLTLTGTIIVMFILSPLLTLLTLIIVPLLFVGMNWITNRTNRYFKQQQHDLGDLNGYVEEALSGHDIIKLFNQEERVKRDFIEKNQRLKESSYWAQVYTGFIPKIMNSLNNLSFAIIVGVGGIFAFNGMISIGVIVTFTAYARQFTRPLNDLANQFNVILSAVSGAERVFDVMDEEKEDKNDVEIKNRKRLKGKVEFQSVYFSYGQDDNTLNNVSFIVNPGDTVALVGPTGAGKTTVVSLLSKFYEVEKGKIMLDDQDINKMSRSGIRSQMGIVLQDSFLFDTTIKENIRYGRLDATDHQIITAAKSANAHTFISQLPDGYDTILDSNGYEISQGQRQLISIARAMLADPSLLILDEATSSIDTITEIKINEALTKLMKGRTSFVIAHRLNTIQHADLILVLQEGEVIEQGTHKELIKRNGFYAQLNASQNRAINE